MTKIRSHAAGDAALVTSEQSAAPLGEARDAQARSPAELLRLAAEHATAPGAPEIPPNLDLAAHELLGALLRQLQTLQRTADGLQQQLAAARTEVAAARAETAPAVTPPPPPRTQRTASLVFPCGSDDAQASLTSSLAEIAKREDLDLEVTWSDGKRRWELLLRTLSVFMDLPKPRRSVTLVVRGDPMKTQGFLADAAALAATLLRPQASWPALDEARALLARMR
jgi:hypothetical protein